jgi:predicted RNase H-like nuclease
VARELLDGHPLECVAVDMPPAPVQITGRRFADNLVSQAFERAECGTHSPSRERPGWGSVALRDRVAEAGFPLATAATARGTARPLIEVYPGPAIVRLLRCRAQVRYKLARARQYRPHMSPARRRAGLVRGWRRIADGQGTAVAGVERIITPLPTNTTRAAMNGYEDTLDALVCAWVGTRYLEREADPYGDDTAAIWIPRQNR